MPTSEQKLVAFATLIKSNDEMVRSDRPAGTILQQFLDTTYFDDPAYKPPFYDVLQLGLQENPSLEIIMRAAAVCLRLDSPKVMKDLPILKKLRINIIGDTQLFTALLNDDQHGFYEKGMNLIVLNSGHHNSKAVAVTMVHELTHALFLYMYANNCNPYMQDDTASKDKLDEILRNELPKAVRYSKRKASFEALTSLMLSSLSETIESVALDSVSIILATIDCYPEQEKHTELVARLPEMFFILGDVLARKVLSEHYPVILDYYDNSMLPMVNQFITEHRELTSRIPLIETVSRQQRDIAWIKTCSNLAQRVEEASIDELLRLAKSRRDFSQVVQLELISSKFEFTLPKFTPMINQPLVRLTDAELLADFKQRYLKQFHSAPVYLRNTIIIAALQDDSITWQEIAKDAADTHIGMIRSRSYKILEDMGLLENGCSTGKAPKVFDEFFERRMELIIPKYEFKIA